MAAIKSIPKQAMRTRFAARSGRWWGRLPSAPLAALAPTRLATSNARSDRTA